MAATTTRTPIGNEHIDEFLDDVHGLKSDGTYQTRHSDLKNFYGWMQDNGHDDVTELSARDIRKYLIWNDRQGYAPATIQSRYMSVTMLFKELSGIYDVIDEDDNPMENLDYMSVSGLMEGTKKTDDDPDNVVFVTPEEVNMMCEDAPNPQHRNQLILRILFQTGVRVQECRDMKLEHVDRDERSIQIHSQKTDDWRTVWWQPGKVDTLMAMWVDHLRDTHSPAAESDHLFLTNRSEKLGKSRIQEMVRDTAKRAGIQSVLYTDPAGKDHHRITPHAFRHGHCVNAVRNDIDIAFVREHVGHESIETTKRYLQFKEEEIRDAYHRFDTA
ncbi:tyrosine-type recombinase/integrase [Halococcus saccharolyticus]|uniref:Site-specific recombinase xerd n=1 Tax=Halococcus saccharolyticus DSM 5350 TaxID=1227455 RepID=M0MJH0_9EURY|nr:tyrosine-type recombinase/integrase [Halococcus saccharolyticus]EMA45493.1 site-specific recombinase xerd [Halococcus saccharolyticus DSM 5350]